MRAAHTWISFALSVVPLIARGGPPAICFDYRGIEVQELPDYSLRDVAVANVLPNGQPVILYHPLVNTAVSDQTKWFIYAHECAHHVLAHTADDARAVNELEADCWAISALYEKGILNDRDVKVVQAELVATGRADATHLSGAERARNLDTCLMKSRSPVLIYTAAR